MEEWMNKMIAENKKKRFEYISIYIIYYSFYINDYSN